jgi:hypothetical protein
VPITITFDGAPLDTKLRQIETAARPLASDMLLVMNQQKTRILDRTARGVDVNEQAFAPYSEKGPYYYYPSGPVHEGAQRSFNFSLSAYRKRRATAAANFARAVKNRKGQRGLFEGNVGRRRGSVGVRFDSYGAFKRSLGRSVVDLMGPKAPHMLQAIVVRTFGGGEGAIGIYGPEADRAEGHNLGVPRNHLPQRYWFGVSDSDETAMNEELADLTAARIREV